MELLGGHHVIPKRFEQRLDQLRQQPDPLRHRGAIELEPRTGIDLALPVQGQMIAVIRRTLDYAESRSANTCDGRSWCDFADELRHSHGVRAGSGMSAAGRWHGIDQVERRWVRSWRGSSL